MSDSNQRKTGALLSYVSIIASTIVGLLYTPFLVNLLGKSEYGLYSMVSSIIGYLTVLDLGFGNALIVYTTKYNEKKQYDKVNKMYGMFFVIYSIIGIIAALIGIILYFNVSMLFSETLTDIEIHKLKIMMLILAFNTALTFIFSIYTSIITANEKFVFQKIMSIINTLLKPLFMIPLLFLGFKSITMCIVITIVNVIVLLSNYYYCRKKLNIKIKYSGFDKVLFKTILGYSIFICLSVIVDKVNWSVDQVILGAVSGTAAVSIYSVASQLNTLFINLSTAVSGVFLPKMSKLVSKGASSEVLTNEMIKIGRIQYYIIFLMATGIILVGKDFFVLWAGKDYSESFYVALILILPGCFPLIQNVGISIMQAMNKYKFKAISTFIMAIFNVIISYFLAIKYGPIGTAIGTAIALTICNIFIINIYYKKVIKLDVFRFWLDIAKMTCSFLIPLSIIIVIDLILKLNGIKQILVIGGLYTILFCITSYFITMNKYEKNIIDKIFIRLKLKKEN